MLCTSLLHPERVWPSLLPGSPILSATTASKLVEYFSSCEGERGESGERVRWRDGG